jgi:hypothetical protein
VAAQRDGVSIATLRRSKFDLGVKSAKDGKTDGWYLLDLAACGRRSASLSGGNMIILSLGV